MEHLVFDRYEITYAPSSDMTVTLYDNDTDEMIDSWDDLLEARMDIDYSPVGNEITLEQWQKLWDWVEGILQGIEQETDHGAIKNRTWIEYEKNHQA